MKLWLNVFCSPMRAKPIMCVPAGLNEAPTWKKKIFSVIMIRSNVEVFQTIVKSLYRVKIEWPRRKKGRRKKKMSEVQANVLNDLKS